MAEYKRPENPHSFKKGTGWYMAGLAAMVGGFVALLHGNSEMNQTIGYDEGVDDGTVALANWSRDTIHEIKDEQNDDNEESP